MRHRSNVKEENEKVKGQEPRMQYLFPTKLYHLQKIYAANNIGYNIKVFATTKSRGQRNQKLEGQRLEDQKRQSQKSKSGCYNSRG